MLVSLSIQLPGECGNVSEMNLLLLFAAHCSGVASPDLLRFYCLCEDTTPHTSCQKQLLESFQSCYSDKNSVLPDQKTDPQVLNVSHTSSRPM